MDTFTRYTASLLIALSAAACTEETGQPDPTEDTSQDPQFTAEGALIRPESYREWIYVSSGLGMSYGPETPAGDPPFDNLFVHPDAYRAFKTTGLWPDKTIFTMELRRSVNKGSINQNGHYQGEVFALEAAVKDEARFPEKWAYFGFQNEDGSPADTAEVMPKESCFSCHAASAAVDNTFVQFYPTLLEIAERYGTVRPDYPK